MKKVLITGGAGFIGSNLANKLVKKGYDVVVLDNLSEQIHGKSPKITSPLFQSLLGSIEFIKGTVTSRDDWSKALRGVDAVVHLAAETGTGQSMYEVAKYIDVNIGGTGILLDILANDNHQIKKIVVASSRAIYGEGKYNCSEHGIVFPTSRIEADLSIADFECKCPQCGGAVTLLATNEDSQIHPTSIYGITKQNQEQMILAMGESLGISAIAFRYQNVYGPGQSLLNPYTGILSIFSTQIKNGNNINIFEDGLESRDFVYIDDVVDATILGLESERANGIALNVGADKPITVLQVAETLINTYASNVDIHISGNYRLGDIRHNYADLTIIKKELDFTPKWSFKNGVSMFASWVNQQPIKEDRLSISLEEMRKKGLLK